MITINKIISQIDGLKPVPQVLIQLMELIDDKDAPITEVADLIIYEPVITANLLKTVNSVHFGLPRKIDSVHEAVILLGLNQIVDIILMQAMTNNFKTAQDGYGLKEGELWKQSVSSALIAKLIARHLKTDNKHTIFTAALIKDIGKIILNQEVADSLEKIKTIVEKNELSFQEAEKQVIGMDHATIGALVAEKWNFSKQMIFMIKNHHISDKTAIDHPGTQMIYLADIICVMLGIHSEADKLSYQFYDDVIKRLNLSESGLNKIMTDFTSRKDDIFGLLAVI